MMKKVFWLIVVVDLAWAAVWAAQVRFEPAPRLLGTFQIVVEGVMEDTGKAFLFNAQSGRRWELDLKRDGDVLKSELLQVLRPCDKPVVNGALAVEVSGVGELLVVGTELACGLSAAAKVGPREGAPKIYLEVKDGDEWRETTVLGAGEHRLRVFCPSADRTCEPDPLPQGLEVQASGVKKIINLYEDSPNSGVFVWEFSGAFQLDREKQQLLYVISWGEEELVIPAVCTTVSFIAIESELTAKVQLLPVKIEPATLILLPVSCQAKLQIVEPPEPDEVLWWVPVRGWFSGVSLELRVDEPLVQGIPEYPEALLTKVFVRKGGAWGVNQLAISVIPKPELCFVDPESGRKILAPWSVDKAFKLRASGLVAFAEEVLIAQVGKLGPHPNEASVKLHQVEEGVYESDPLSPKDWKTQTGDVLWAQIRHPGFPECVFTALLYLR